MRPCTTSVIIKELHRRLQADHLATRIVCCDGNPGDGEGQWTIAREILKDPELATSIDAIGVHYPFWDGGITTTDPARKRESRSGPAKISQTAEGGLLSAATGLSADEFSPMFLTELSRRVAFCY